MTESGPSANKPNDAGRQTNRQRPPVHTATALDPKGLEMDLASYGKSFQDALKA